VLRLLVCGVMALFRLAELLLSRRNIAVAGPSRETQLNRRLFPVIVALHSVVIVTTLVRGRSQPNLSWLTALLVVQPLRFWTLLTLGRWWNARGSVAEATEVATSGPYRYVRHPNYAVVLVELAALPSAFGLARLALAATAANCLLLAVRIREEERLLFTLPGYSAHFARRPRFIPRLRFRSTRSEHAAHQGRDIARPQ
jgi:methyltransferase